MSYQHSAFGSQRFTADGEHWLTPPGNFWWEQPPSLACLSVSALVSRRQRSTVDSANVHGKGTRVNRRNQCKSLASSGVMQTPQGNRI